MLVCLECLKFYILSAIVAVLVMWCRIFDLVSNTLATRKYGFLMHEPIKRALKVEKAERWKKKRKFYLLPDHAASYRKQTVEKAFSRRTELKANTRDAAKW